MVNVNELPDDPALLKRLLISERETMLAERETMIDRIKQEAAEQIKRLALCLGPGLLVCNDDNFVGRGVFGKSSWGNLVLVRIWIWSCDGPTISLG